MKKIILLFIFSNTLINCQSAPKTTFSEVALNDKLEQMDGASVDFAAILEKHSGKPLFYRRLGFVVQRLYRRSPKAKGVSS